MAATPKRAAQAEATLRGQVWSAAAFEAAANALEQDFAPLSDWRASKEYRMTSARNLLRRFFLEHDTATTQPVQLTTR
jgi:xanthine dehydrogenase small subunit